MAVALSIEPRKRMTKPRNQPCGSAAETCAAIFAVAEVSGGSYSFSGRMCMRVIYFARAAPRAADSSLPAATDFFSRTKLPITSTSICVR